MLFLSSKTKELHGFEIKESWGKEGREAGAEGMREEEERRSGFLLVKRRRVRVWAFFLIKLVETDGNLKNTFEKMPLYILTYNHLLKPKEI